MIDFQTRPDRYHHWKLSFDGEVARLALAVDPAHAFRDGYELKLNSYDLAVDLELQDAVQRVRFEHPEVAVIVVTSAVDRVFCAGANIPMLATSEHSFKVNFCKFTNETRMSLEDASKGSKVRSIAAINGPCAGGGYELAIACDEIYLVDDNSSAVALPEVPLLGVLPGTGGLTRLVDKRRVRRDRADVFSTLAEGMRGKRAKQWGLVDDTWPKSRFAEKVVERAKAVAATVAARGPAGSGITLGPLTPRESDTGIDYEHVSLRVDRSKRTATLTVRAPSTPQPKTGVEYVTTGDKSWFLRCFRELDDALLQLRFGFEDIGVVLLETRGDLGAVLAAERDLVANAKHWLCNEIILLVARVLRRYELTARSFFALVASDSAFGGVLFELALAGDRIYGRDDPDHPVSIAIGPLSDGLLPMANGLTRLQSRFLGDPARAARLSREQPTLTIADADEEGLVTFLVEDIDWDDDVRIAVEERASLSPDALTGMEASLRFCGAETCDSKIFGRLSAWQNWIFTRPNATGENGALVAYGRPEPSRFDWTRT